MTGRLSRRAAGTWSAAPRATMPAGLSLPRAYHVTDLDEQSAAIWLGCVPVRRTPWDVERHRHAGSGRCSPPCPSFTETLPGVAGIRT